MPEPRQEDQSDYYHTGGEEESEEDFRLVKRIRVNNCTCRSVELNNALYYVIFYCDIPETLKHVKDGLKICFGKRRLQDDETGNRDSHSEIH